MNGIKRLKKNDMCNNKLTFTIYGDPVPWHTYVRGHMSKDEAKRQKRLKAWQAQIALQVQSQLPDDFEPWNGPIMVRSLIFRLRRSKTCKDKYPIKVNDIDRLQNALYDALEGVKISCHLPPIGIVYTNDRRIIGHKDGPWKIWATEDNPPGVSLEIERME